MTENKSLLEIKNVFQFRKIASEEETYSNIKLYTLILDASDVPNIGLDDWRGVNVRDANLKSGVSKEIMSSLKDSPENFLLKNRGLTLMVSKVRFDQKDNTVRLELSDEKRHGLLDGGHTYGVICEHYCNNEEEGVPQDKAKVLFQIIEVEENVESGNDNDLLVQIVGARNTSTQVKNESLDNLEGSFSPIKDILKEKSYGEEIAYKEYELTDEGSKKTISIRDILSFIECFRIDKYENDSSSSDHPTKAYSGKAAIVKDLGSLSTEDRKSITERYSKILPDILELHDLIYRDIPAIYNRNGGSFGLLTGVKKKSKKIDLDFTDYKSEYSIPLSFILPILASFRVLLEEENGRLFWKFPPKEVWEDEKVQNELVAIVGEEALETKHPTKMGKKKSLWKSCLQTVRIYKLRKLAQEARDN